MTSTLAQHATLLLDDHYGTYVPATSAAPDHTVSPMWVDTSSAPAVLKSWNGSAWVTAIPGTAAAMALVFGG